MATGENQAICGRRWQKRHIRAMLLVGLMAVLAVVGGCAGGETDQSGTDAAEQTAEQTTGQISEETTATEETTALEETAAMEETTAVEDTAAEDTGTVIGVVTDEETGEPLPNTYITVGWDTLKLVGITDEEGRYTVDNVPTGVPAPTFGFHDGGYRYRASSFDDNLEITLEPGETYTYDFSLTMLPPEGQPELSEPTISSDTAAPGETVTFGVSASNGAGGLSPEIFAANPEFRRLALLEPTDEENVYRSEFTIPEDTPPGEYEFAFFAASNECFVNGEFPTVTLTVAA